MTAGAAAPERGPGSKVRAAKLSIASNLSLIMLKVVAGMLTGSVAILTEAVHSSIDLIASVVALFSVRKADEPADETHRYGHEKIENLAAAIEGMLILVGSGVIVVQAIPRLLGHRHLERLDLGIAVVALSLVVNLVVSRSIDRSARTTGSAALEGDAAHLRSDALSSLGVLLALVAVRLTGADWIDPAVALVVAAAIVASGIRILSRSSRVLVDEALPDHELEAIRRQIAGLAGDGVIGYHKLRTRRAGARRYIDLHVQFRAGTSLEDAHETAHRLQDAIARALQGADVLIHLEPASRVRPDAGPPGRGGAHAGGAERAAVTGRPPASAG